MHDEWVDKYAPKKLAHVILPQSYKKFFQGIVDGGVVPNMLIESNSPGTGKSTIAKVLADELGVDSMFINASTDGGISTLRDDISSYAKTASLIGDPSKPKVVILDEADFMSPTMQAGLRGAMDEFKANCRFWLTCNFEHKIIKPIKDSRMKKFSFAMTTAETKRELIPTICERVNGILERENVKYDPTSVRRFVEQKYPDIRSTYNVLEQFASMYDLVDDRILSHSEVDDNMLDIIKTKNVLNVRRAVVDNGYDYDYMYTYLFNKISSSYTSTSAQSTSDYNHS